MADGTTPDGTAGESPNGRARSGRAEKGPAPDGPSAGVDLRWAGRQRLLALIGTAVSILALLAGIGGVSVLPMSAADARPYAITAVVAVAVLALACVLTASCWLLQIPEWRSAAKQPTRAERSRNLVSLVAHLASYPAALVTMYGALAASAITYWDSLAATLLGITFLLAIFGQILAGTQLLRRSGPPATIPFYLRRLNEKVQSMR